MEIPLRRDLQLLGTYLRPHRMRLLLLALLLTASIGLQLFNPRVLQGVIDAAAAGSPLPHLLRGAALFLGVALAIQLLSVLATYVSQDLGWRATNRLRSDLTRHVLGLDPSFHQRHSPGELIERIDGDVTLLANFFSQFVVLVLANGVLLSAILAVLFAVDWRVGLALTGLAAVHLAVLLRTRSIALPGWQAARQASAEFFGFLGERLAGTADIRANGATAYVLRSFYVMLRRRLQAELKAGRGMAVMLVISLGLLALSMTTAFAVSASLYSAGSISVGTAYMIFFYTEQLRRPVEQIVQQVQDLGRAGASVGRIQALLATRPRIDQSGSLPLPPGPLSVEVTGLSCFWGSCRSRRERSAGTGGPWPTPPPTSSRPAAATPPRCRSCSARA